MVCVLPTFPARARCTLLLMRSMTSPVERFCRLKAAPLGLLVGGVAWGQGRSLRKVPKSAALGVEQAMNSDI